MSLPPDIDSLVQACAREVGTAQRELYEHLYPYGMSIALHYAGNRPEAEEICQDSFVKLFRQLPKQTPEGSVRTYFGRIVVNAAIDLLRRRIRRPPTEEVTEASSGSERNLGEDRLQEEEIYRLLQRVPPTYRLVFNLYVLEGYTHSEIANRLGIKEGTSKSNLFKARKFLRQLAAKYYHLSPSKHQL